MAIKRFETLDGLGTTGAAVVSNTLTVSSNLVVNSDTLFVDTVSGQVGIGTASPNTTLEVIGGITATSFVGDGSGLTGVGANDAATLNGSTANDFVQVASNSTIQNSRLTLTNSNVLVSTGYIRLLNDQKLHFGNLDNPGNQLFFNAANNELIVAGSNIRTSNTITANAFVGDGSGLTNVATAAQGTLADIAHGWGDHSDAGYLVGPFGDTMHGNRGGGNLHANVTTTVDGFMAAADKVKLNGVEAGAQVNTVDSVNGHTGSVVLTSSDVGAAPVSHTHPYLPTAGGAMSGMITGRSCAATDVNEANDLGSMSIRGSSGTVAAISFHRTGAYAVNMGLGTDNVFRIGGWSATVDAFTLTCTGGHLSIKGNGTATDWIATSDIRLKDNISPLNINNCLNQINQLIPSSFTWRESGEEDTGLIAQQVQEVLPERVKGDDQLAVSYAKITTQLIGAVQALSKEIEELKRSNTI